VRTLVFAVLVAALAALVTWIMTRGAVGGRGDACSTAVAAAAPSSDPDQVLLSLFSGLPDKLSLTGQPRLYDEKGLFEYIDGAAPIFIERHFRKLASAEMKSLDGGELTCDIYDMQSRENAGSIFAVERPRTAQPLGVGDEGHRGRMSTVFRRGRYYAKLTAFNPAGESALAELARVLATKMP
jgi:hypothetical protein